MINRIQEFSLNDWTEQAYQIKHNPVIKRYEIKENNNGDSFTLTYSLQTQKNYYYEDNQTLYVKIIYYIQSIVYKIQKYIRKIDSWLKQL